MAFARPKSRTFRSIREVGRIRASRLELDVRGFEIAVDDALFVRGLEGRGDLRCQRQGLTNRDRSSSDPLSEIVALDELHDERASACRGFQPVNNRDVRMIERREDLSFALQARETFGIGCDRRWQHLDRDVAMEVGVAGAIDLTHPPAPMAGDDLIGADARQRQEPSVDDYTVPPPISSSFTAISSRSDLMSTRRRPNRLM